MKLNLVTEGEGRDLALSRVNFETLGLTPLKVGVRDVAVVLPSTGPSELSLLFLDDERTPTGQSGHSGNRLGKVW